MGTYCYVAVCRRGRLGEALRRSPMEERAGYIVADVRLQLVFDCFR